MIESKSEFHRGSWEKRVLPIMTRRAARRGAVRTHLHDIYDMLVKAHGECIDPKYQPYTQISVACKKNKYFKVLYELKWFGDGPACVYNICTYVVDLQKKTIKGHPMNNIYVSGGANYNELYPVFTSEIPIPLKSLFLSDELRAALIHIFKSE